MKRIYKVCVLVVLIDLLIYLLLFHCGIILPLINPSVEVYSKKITSFPRDTMQKVIWIIFHFPTLFFVKIFIKSDKQLFLLVIQNVWVILLGNRILNFFRKKNSSLEKPPDNERHN
jgi:hypothetical protein